MLEMILPTHVAGPVQIVPVGGENINVIDGLEQGIWGSHSQNSLSESSECNIPAPSGAVGGEQISPVDTWTYHHKCDAPPQIRYQMKDRVHE